MMKLTASVSGPDPRGLLVSASEISAFATTPPVRLEVDDDEPPVGPSWVAELNRAKIDACAFWENKRKQIEIRPKSDLVTLSIPGGFASSVEGIELIEPLPFELIILGSVFFDEWIDADYPRWGVGRSTLDHGWGCIFRGAGHDRLVSRRWLDFGPWRVIRRPNDTTVIQFHDLAITDPAEAYEQARAGHQRMGNSPTGGYIAWHLQGLLKNAGKGLYVAESRTLEVVVAPGLAVSQGEMLGNAALRLHHRTTQLTQPIAQPIEHVAYLFIDEADARAHLHELWLRELQCWAFDAHGVKHRLDLDYHPVPDPPAWVRSLDGR